VAERLLTLHDAAAVEAALAVDVPGMGGAAEEGEADEIPAG
jgi:hypothetical protein